MNHTNRPSFYHNRSFIELLQHLIQNRFEEDSPSLQEQFIHTAVILGICSQTDSTITVPIIPTSKLKEILSSRNRLSIDGSQSQSGIWDREEDAFILLFNSERTAQTFEERLGITTYSNIPFYEALQGAVQQYLGLCLVNEDTALIIGSDKINEIARANLAHSSQFHEGNPLDAITDLSSDYFLTQSEETRLNKLFQEQNWIERLSLGTCKYNGMKTHVLLVVPQGGISTDQIKEHISKLSSKAVKVKTPFLIVPMPGRPSLGRDFN